MKRAHIVSYLLFNGPIKEGLLVCHKCDNPGCVRPDHLFLGTAKDNSEDMISKGRRKVPKNPKHHCLSKEIADEIRRDHEAGMNYNDLSVKYNTSKPQVCRIVRNQIWK
jgi:hypothetical protein